eukprot:TRINITY_DN12732_c0_g1_i1.p1 TRINITY_DN12732_c0_g1~~TRINITY_DN12732_c0_g1_i1.p1  ORF type:complete len:1802 (-),score=725.23 TRINITY_DN12732_c0_g1_i1:160-5565(-)
METELALLSASYSRLWKSIDSATQIPSNESIKSLSEDLDLYKSALLNPLYVFGPSESAASQVKSGLVVLEGVTNRLSAVFISEALQVSDSLKINQVLAVALLRDALQQLSKFQGKTQVEAAQIMYFHQRGSLLFSLLNLIKSCSSTVSISEDVRSIIKPFVSELIKDGLVKNLLSELKKFGENLDSTPVHLQSNRYEEQNLISECLFFIFYQWSPTYDQYLQVLDILQIKSSKERTSISNQLSSNRHFKTSYILLLTLICMLDPDQDNLLAQNKTEEMERFKGNGLEDFLNKFKQKLSEWKSNPTSDGYKNAVRLAWALFAASYEYENVHVEEELDLCTKGNVFEFLKNLVSDPIFNYESEHKEVYVGVLHKLNGLFFNFAIFYWDARERIPYFYSFLEYLSQLYPNQEEYSKDYWSFQTNNPTVWYSNPSPSPSSSFAAFPRYAMEKINPKDRNTTLLFVPLLKFFTAVSSGIQSSQLVYQFLVNSNHSVVNMRLFFQVLERYRDDFLPQGKPSGGRKDLSPEDTARVVAILKLLQGIITNSEENRLRILGNVDFPLLEILFQLINCPLPPLLKAELTNTIRSLAKSPEIVHTVWSLLEASQILPTVPQSKADGIKYELDEVESRNQEYYYSTSFSSLLFQLASFSIPRQLGLPYRNPGINPYVQFVRDSLLGGFDKRQYRIPSEKWVVAASALEFLHTVLDKYDVPNEDFIRMEVEVGGKPVRLEQSAGFILMDELLRGHSVLLSKIRFILEEGKRSLLDNRWQENGEYFERCVLLSLKMIETIFKKEEQYFEKLRLSNSPTPDAPLSQILLLNRNILVVIAQFVDYPLLDDIPLHSVRVIQQYCKRQSNLVDVLVDAGEEMNVLASYVTRLETEEQSEYVESDESKSIENRISEEGGLQTRRNRSIRLAIVRLILENLNSENGRSRRISYFLLGFNFQVPLYQNDLESSPIVSCLNVILDLLNSDSFSLREADLCEESYELIHSLCADPFTCPPVMDLLRSNRRDFFGRQLELLSQINQEEGLNVSQLRQRAWLLKTISLEIHLGKNPERLLSLLYEDDNSISSFIPSENLDRPNDFVLQLLEGCDTLITEPKAPTRSSFSFDSTVYFEEKGVKLVDIPSLYENLNNQRRQENGVAETEKVKEMRETLAYATDWNQFARTISAQQLAFEGWSQLIETSMARHFQYLRKKGREFVFFDIIESLLKKLNKEEVRLDLASSLSTTVLYVIAKIREGNLDRSYEDSSVQNERDLSLDQPVLILENIIRSAQRSASNFSVRGNLCSALINFLQFLEHPNKWNSGVAMSAELKEAAKRKIADNICSVLEEKADGLVRLICQDAAGSSRPLWTSIAYSTLDALLIYDRKSRYPNYLFQSGFMGHFLNEMKMKGDSLHLLLGEDANMAQQLVIYECKMSFLVHLAQSGEGARKLLELGIVPLLSSIQFIDRKPLDYVDDNEWLPTITERYSRLLFPILRVINDLQKSLTINRTLSAQVAEFVDSHSDMISNILQDQGSISYDSLQTLSMVVSIFQQLFQQGDSELNRKFMAKRESDLVKLLCKYTRKWQDRVVFVNSTNSSNGDSMDIDNNTGDDNQKVIPQSIKKAVNNLCQLIIGTLCVLVDSDRNAMPLSLFSSSIGTRSTADAGQPSLKNLVNFLENCVASYLNISREMSEHQSKLEDKSKFSGEEQTLLASALKNDVVTPQQRLSLAILRLSQLLEECSARQLQLFYMIENALYVLWKQLSVYIEAPKSKADDARNFKEQARDTLEPLLEDISDVDKQNDSKRSIAYILVRQIRTLLRETK